jgi:ketosteroid isomerase-like protein
MRLRLDPIAGSSNGGIMIRHLGFRARATAILAVMTIGVSSAEASGAAVSDADAIRDLRLGYNHAIELREAGAFVKFLSPTFVEMDSTGAVTIGGKTVADSYAAAEFKDPTFIAYDRHPDTIDVAQNRRFAVERGHWRARFRDPNGAEVGASGLYQAGWVRIDGDWRIQSEAYVRLTCRREPVC